MRVHLYSVHPFTLTITVATPRAADASLLFTAARIHEDYAARVRWLLRHHRQVGPTAEAYPAAQRLTGHLPAGYYGLRSLQPAGAPRDIDTDFQLEITRIRYAGVLVDLPGCFQAGIEGEARERHLEKAVKDLFQANDVPNDFIPGDDGRRDDTRTCIDIIAELGPSDGLIGADIPAP